MLKTDKINLQKNKSFCILPFVHLHINENNDIKPCCMAGLNGLKKYSSEFDYSTDPDLNLIREKMIKGERLDNFCQDCYRLEDSGTYSSRTEETKLWLQKLGWETYEDCSPELVYYDIRNDNLCNLSCRMCNPQFSSQLEKEFKKIGWAVEYYPKNYGFSDVVDINTVKKIYVAGGEPSLMPGFRDFLTRAIACGRTDIEIRMNTNATNLNKEYRELLKHFKELHIVVSLDGYDQINKYIRWPADWNSIVNNVQGLYEITDYISFNVTVGIWNISNLSRLVFFLEEEFPNTNVLLNRIYNPEFLTFTTFPNKDLALADLEKCKLSKFYNQFLFKDKLDYYINETKSSTINVPALTDFFKFNDKLDQSRNIKLIDYIPELEECRNYLTKH